MEIQTRTTDDGAVITTEYQYSSDGRLLKIITPEKTIEYRHNAIGNRVAKLINGQVVEKYLWQNKTTLLATYDAHDNIKQRFEYTLGHALTAFTQNNEKYFILSDRLGSPRLITDSSGNAVKEITYDSYGNVIFDSNENFELPFGFAGGLHDKDTGLLRFGCRDYDPETGRWTARDPIGFEGGDSNLYGYVMWDPINLVDPEGRNGLAVTGVVIASYFGYQFITGHIEAHKQLQIARESAQILKKAEAGQMRCLNVGVCSYKEKIAYDELVKKHQANNIVKDIAEAGYNLGRNTSNTSFSGFGPPSFPTNKTEAICELGKNAILELGDRE